MLVSSGDVDETPISISDALKSVEQTDERHSIAI
jgi:hypothetical protein